MSSDTETLALLDTAKVVFLAVKLTVLVAFLSALAYGSLVSPYSSLWTLVTVAVCWAICAPLIFRTTCLIACALRPQGAAMFLDRQDLIFATPLYRRIDTAPVLRLSLVKERNWAQDLDYLEVHRKGGRKIALPVYLLAGDAASAAKSLSQHLDAPLTDERPERPKAKAI